MTRVPVLAAIVCVFLGCLPAYAADIPDDLKADVALAQARGAALFETAKTFEPTDDTKPTIEAARSLISDFCDFKYRPIVVQESASQLVYFVAEKNNDIVMGRHYRVEGARVTPSTNSCFAAKEQPGAVGFFITHLLSKTPTEFHVYESLLHGMTIYVITSKEMKWKVDEGTISLFD